MNKLQFMFVFENTNNSPTFVQDVHSFITLLQKIMEKRISFIKLTEKIEEILKETQ